MLNCGSKLFMVAMYLPISRANLRDAAAGENYEHTTMYKDFADEAEKKALQKSLPNARSW